MHSAFPRFVKNDLLLFNYYLLSLIAIWYFRYPQFSSRILYIYDLPMKKILRKSRENFAFLIIVTTQQN